MVNLTLPPSYPTLSPPSYSYSAPFLSLQDKRHLEQELETIVLENLGESVLFLWVEKVRELLEQSEDNSAVPEQSEDTPEPELGHPSVPCPTILTGSVLEDRRSVFQGHVARVASVPEVRPTHQVLQYKLQAI